MMTTISPTSPSHGMAGIVITIVAGMAAIDGMAADIVMAGMTVVGMAAVVGVDGTTSHISLITEHASRYAKRRLLAPLPVSVAAYSAAARSGWVQNMNGAGGHEVFYLLAIGGHMRCSGMCLQRVHACPFLDDDERIRPECRIGAVDIHDSRVFDAAVFGVNSRNVRLEGFEHFGPLAGQGGEDGENVNHDDVLETIG